MEDLPEQSMNKPSSSEQMKQISSFLAQNKTFTFPLFIFVLVIIGSFIIRESIFSPVRTATVVGVGKIKVQPEKATVSFSMIYNGISQEDAVTEGERRFNNILDGISPYQPEVDRTAYQIVPSDTSSSVGTTNELTSRLLRNSYQYVNAAKVTISDPTKIQEVVKNLYNNGASVVTPIRYMPADEDKVNREVRELAVKDAKERISQMAKASGARIGKVMTIQEGDLTGQTDAAIGAAAGSDPIQTSGVNISSSGEVEIRSVVTVTYELR
ncbi:SIMPL domain-containing protein [Patescibacteria group bacterium]